MAHPYQQQQNRRRQQRSTFASAATNIATSALVAYGAYQVAKHWWFSQEEEDEQQQDVYEEVNAGHVPAATTTRRRQGRNQSSFGQQHQETATTTSFSSSNTTTTSWWTLLMSNNNPLFATTAPPPRQQQIDWKIQKQRVAKCRKETQKAFWSCLPQLKQVIEDGTPTTQITKQLKEYRASQNDKNNNNTNNKTMSLLWEQLKIETTTRHFCTIYATTLLYLSLTVQIHWMGKQVFLQTTSKTTTTNTTTRHNHSQQQQQQHQRLLVAIHDYFFQQGLPSLICTIRNQVTKTLNRHEITSQSLVKDMELQFIFKDLFDVLQHGTTTTSSSTTRFGESREEPSLGFSRNWIRFVLPEDIITIDEDENETTTTCTEDGHDDANNNINNALYILWDICQSPVWEDAQQQVLQMTAMKLQQEGWGKLFLLQPPADESNANNGNDDKSSNKKKKQTPSLVPMAKLMTPLKQSTDWLLATNAKDNNNNNNKEKKTTIKTSLQTTIKEWQQLPSMMELGTISFQQ